ncbi:hypothetical protein FSP39_000840 [Pinctada imbricata]|uniref:Uncharacterized protein n=1 Tax=Pinctada imbricata TaxID=66713 RepID=A0AA88YII7_PINIB|nr:hypothetical protein FSP39_000840 [Pinctada imbricata]
MMNYCMTKDTNCNCDGSRARVTDEGKMLEKDFLPIQRVVFGYENGYANHFSTIGDVVCAPKPVDYPRNCDEVRNVKKIETSGPQIIDPDGPDGWVLPGLVHCDMDSISNVGITVIPLSTNSPQNVTVSGSNPIKYVVNETFVKAVVDNNPFCRQDVEYTCTNSAISNTGSGFRSTDGKIRDYFPGGMSAEAMCGCGLTGTCQDTSKQCNCDILDGQTRKDLGTVLNRDDLPIVDLVFNDIDEASGKTGQFHISSLKCAPIEFGFEVNCERILDSGQDYSYTYLIDPDGAQDVKDPDPTDVSPFPVECRMVEEPPHAITVIHHDKEENQEIVGGEIEYNYRLVTEAQLLKLRKRSQYCRQSLVYGCNNAAITAEDGSSLAYWTEIDGSKNYYFSGIQGKGCDCGFSGTCEGGVNASCNCDIVDGTPRSDAGTLLDKEDLPLMSMNVQNDAGTASAELGPLECLGKCMQNQSFTLRQFIAKTVIVFLSIYIIYITIKEVPVEVFPTCSSLYYFYYFKRFPNEQMIPMANRPTTIDPDLGGPLEPFVVTCSYSVSTVPIVPDDVTKVDNNPDQDGPMTKCFNVTYANGVTPEQLQALKDQSKFCTQELKYKCNNAPRTDKVWYQTCDGRNQTGWSGTRGKGEMCACGITGQCIGGPGALCNCDTTDGKNYTDEGWIHDMDRMPVCHICITLDPVTPSEPSRMGAYVVSELSCNNGPIGMYESCQDRRNARETNSGTVFVNPGGVDNGPAFPVYCDFTYKPPVGATVIRPKNRTVPVQNTTIEIVYFVFNFTYIEDLVKEAVYCEQAIYVLCNGSSPPTEEEGRKLNDWEISPEGGIQCRAGSCTCAEEGKKWYGGYVKTQVFPTTKVNLPESSEDRSLSIEDLKCLDVYKDCHEIKMAGKDKNPLHNDVYAIDPDGSGGVQLFAVTCDFKTNEEIGITEVPIIKFGEPVKFNVVGELDPESNSYAISYPDATPEQINTLTVNSEFCYQEVQYKCTETPLINGNSPPYGYLNTYESSQSPSFGTGTYSNVSGCACTLTQTCPEGKSCHCDAKGPMTAYDYGKITDNSILPVTRVSLGGQTTDTANAELTLTNVRCAPQPIDLPKDCEEAYQLGYETGEVLIYPAVSEDPFFVMCDMTMVPNHGVTIVGNDREEPTPAEPNTGIKVTYHNVTDEQITKLVQVSAFCFQPIKYDCFNTRFIGYNTFSWLGSDVGVEQFLGTGNQGECTCGREHLCGGDLPRSILKNRKCNCDAAEEIWRRDGGIMNTTKDLPVLSMTFSGVGADNTSMGTITLGKLYCSQHDFDLDECEMDFDDCHDDAICTNTYGGFKCQCKEGYRGAGVPDVWPNGRNCYDDNECELGMCPYSANCTNTIGSFRCTCLEGYIQTGDRTCKDIDECSNPSLNDCDPNARCINLDGSYECRCQRGFRGDGKECTSIGLCTCFGDPHCISFDQKWLHFQGECQYVMSTDGCNQTSYTYSVKTEHWDQDTGIKGVTWVKSVTIDLQGSYLIQLKQDHVVHVDGFRRTVPYNPDESLKIRRYGNWIEVYTNRGVQVNWDGFQAVEVIVDKEFQSKTCGLCGDYNMDDSDDWRIGPQCEGSGELTTNFVKFGHSYVDQDYRLNNPQCTFDCNQPPTNPVCEGEDRLIAESVCDKILNDNGVFKDCLRDMDDNLKDEFRSACIYDVCAVPDDKSGQLCNSAQNLAKECQKHLHMEIKDWRSSELCSPHCDYEMEYTVCATSDQIRTCLDVLNPTISNVATIDGCQEGCYCKEGKVLDGGKCVEEEECGCYYNNTYYSAGEQIVTDQCQETWVCRENKTFIKSPLECSDNATCGLKDGIYGCHCNEGYRGNGSYCRYDPCGTEPCNSNEDCKLIDESPGYQCECKMGYQGDCNKCEDIDECATRTHECPFNSKCVNNEGSYTCDCWNGFTKIDGKCEDVNECTMNTDNCNSSTKCFNRPGGYHCEPCTNNGGTGCCACFGFRCGRTGKVCGVNTKTNETTTFNSEAEMIIASCEEHQKTGAHIHVSYRSSCKSSCDMVDCPLWQECEMVGGNPVCVCEECSPAESDPESPKVCSNKLDKYSNMCQFKRVQCRMDLEHIPLYNTTTPCDERGTDPPVTEWTDWAPCSVTCGVGTQTRNRNATQDFDWWETITFPLSEAKECYEDPCPDSQCFEFDCAGYGKECIVENDEPTCICPNCTGTWLDPVCGRVGGVRETFKNPCEIQKKACEENKPFDILNKGECGATPLNCTRMANELRLTNNEGCQSQVKTDIGTCDGACGQMADRCCRASAKSYQQVSYTCSDGSIVSDMVETTEACECLPLPVGSTTTGSTTAIPNLA